MFGCWPGAGKLGLVRVSLAVTLVTDYQDWLLVTYQHVHRFDFLAGRTCFLGMAAWQMRRSSS